MYHYWCTYPGVGFKKDSENQGDLRLDSAEQQQRSQLGAVLIWRRGAPENDAKGRTCCGILVSAISKNIDSFWSHDKTQSWLICPKIHVYSKL